MNGEANNGVTGSWTHDDAEYLKHLYLHGCDKGDMPLRFIADELGRTETACRSKLYRMNRANRPICVKDAGKDGAE